MCGRVHCADDVTRAYHRNHAPLRTVNVDRRETYTLSIITTTSTSALGWLHDRMPVILGDEESTDTWLDGSSSSKFDSLLKPCEDPDLVWYPVTRAMGKVSFDGPECINEIVDSVEDRGESFNHKVSLDEGNQKRRIKPKGHKF